jgi:hypothetical protein
MTRFFLAILRKYAASRTTLLIQKSGLIIGWEHPQKTREIAGQIRGGTG